MDKKSMTSLPLKRDKKAWPSVHMTQMSMLYRGLLCKSKSKKNPSYFPQNADDIP